MRGCRAEPYGTRGTSVSISGSTRSFCCALKIGRLICAAHGHRVGCRRGGRDCGRLHEEITADYSDMIYAATREEVEARRKAFIRKWRLKHRAVADSLQEAGDRLFTFTRLPPSQWKSARTTNAIERLHEEFRRRIKTQTMLPSADTGAMSILDLSLSP
jgi:hypothetical protein